MLPNYQKCKYEYKMPNIFMRNKKFENMGLNIGWKVNKTIESQLLRNSKTSKAVIYLIFNA